MYWKATLDENHEVIVQLENHVPCHYWSPFNTNRKEGFIKFHPHLNCFFFKDKDGVEQSLRVRNFSVENRPEEGSTIINLEAYCQNSHISSKYEIVIESHIPGLLTSEKNKKISDKVLRSPMVGKIVKVLIKNGQQVSKGQDLLIIEAMKMENKIVAPIKGTVQELNAQEGSQTSIGDILVKIKGY